MTRHTFWKVVVTVGCAICAIVAATDACSAQTAAVIGLCTNIVWIWEG